MGDFRHGKYFDGTPLFEKGFLSSLLLEQFVKHSTAQQSQRPPPWLAIPSWTAGCASRPI